MFGIHHVTAISGNAAQNVHFYTKTLGLRLVKKTVNFDDPGTYHLYYGDEVGHPGTILTFFPWEHAAPGRNGVGQTEETSFRVPPESIGYWAHRFVEKGVVHDLPAKRFGQPVLAFTDPHGAKLVLVGSADASEKVWSNADVAAEHGIRGFHGVTLMLESAGKTAEVLTDVLGFREAGREGSLIRFETADGAPGNVVTLREAGRFLPADMGKGSVHHVAFRAADDEQQRRMVENLVEHGVRTTEQIDRQYFRSVYFREPGGILFEIATDAPGFAVDEPAATLGQELKLPLFLESNRKEIEQALPPIGLEDRSVA